MPGTAWTRPRLGRGPVLGSQAFLVAVLLVWLVAGPLTALTQARLSWLLSVLFNVGTVVAAQNVARRLPAGDPARRFWWAVSAGEVAVTAGNLIQFTVVEGPADLMTGPTAATLIGLGTSVIVVVMLSYPLRLRSGRERVCFWLDMATVMVGAGAFGWYFADHSGGGVPAVLNILTGPVVMLVAVFAVAKLLVAGRPPFGTATGVLGAVAAVFAGLSGAFGAPLLAEGHGTWLALLDTAGDAFMMIAASSQRLAVQADPHALERPRRRPYSTLPYLALAATFTLLAVALAGRGLDGRTWAVLAGAVTSTGLVVVRQLASFADNTRLLGELDAKIRELHAKEAGLNAALAERDAFAARLRELAFSDSLTGLANRNQFQEQLGLALARARRHGTRVVVMLLDLDDFKPINDKFGHAAGDAVLQEVARRLTGSVREIDTVARIGGDDFAVLMDQPLPDAVEAVAERIVAAVREPCEIDGVPMAVGVSVGMAYAGSGEYDAEQLLSDADAAMYVAKSAGKGRYETYPIQLG